MVVYLSEGDVVHAASNLKPHRLSECLRRWQVLTEQQISSLPMAAPDTELAVALVETKTLSREALEVVQAQQVVEVLRPAVLWIDGRWEFDARVRLNREVRYGLDVRNLLVEGARRLPVEFAASRLSDESELLSRPPQVSVNAALLPAESFVLSRLDSPLKLTELLAISSLPEMETKRIVYGLALGGLIRRERWPKALGPTAHAQKRPATVVAPPPSASPPAAPVPPPPPKEMSPPPQTQPAPAFSEVVDLDALFARLETAENHYQVLGLMRTASTAEIKSSYHQLAKRFHPDRFHRDEDAALRARIEGAFARIARAYETLKDKQARAAYDLRLTTMPASPSGFQQQGSSSHAGPQSSGSTAASEAARAKQAEDSYQRGLRALHEGKHLIAIGLLGEAARLSPREARYRAHYGRALAENEGTQRQAEAELKAAIALDPGNAGYYVMLAELYSGLGLARRAQSEVQRALAIDSHNDAARQLLRQLQATLKG